MIRRTIFILTTISTSRLELQPIRPQDAEQLFRVLNDAGLYVFTGDKPPASVEELRARYEWRDSLNGCSPDGTELWFNWLLRVRDRDEVIGCVQATVHSTHAEIAWIVGTRWQRQGYASEAARALVQWLGADGITDIRANIHPAHVNSQNVARNAGLRRSDQTKPDGEEVWLL